MRILWPNGQNLQSCRQRSFEQFCINLTRNSIKILISMSSKWNEKNIQKKKLIGALLNLLTIKISWISLRRFGVYMFELHYMQLYLLQKERNFYISFNNCNFSCSPLHPCSSKLHDPDFSPSFPLVIPTKKLHSEGVQEGGT